MKKFKKDVIQRLIKLQGSGKLIYPLGVAITGSLLFILYDNLEKQLTKNHYDIYCYDFKTNTSLQLDLENGILNPPTINFTAVHACHTYYTFDGRRLIKHTVLC